MVGRTKTPDAAQRVVLSKCPPHVSSFLTARKHMSETRKKFNKPSSKCPDTKGLQCQVKKVYTAYNQE